MKILKLLLLTILIWGIAKASDTEDKRVMLGISFLPSPSVESSNIQVDGEKVGNVNISSDYEIGFALNVEKYTLIPMEEYGSPYLGIGGEVSIIPSKIEDGETKINHYVGYLNGGFLANQIFLIYGGIGYGKIAENPKGEGEINAGIVFQIGLKIFYQKYFFSGIRYREIGGSTKGITNGQTVTSDFSHKSILIDAGINF